MNDVNKFKSCILCESPRIASIPGYEKDFLVKCSNCQFVFCQPIPTLEELQAHYNTYARTDIISPITLKRYEELLETFEPYRKTNNIIDVGCGDGYFLQVAKSKGWNVYGTEYTEKAIEVCSSKGINMKLGMLNVQNYEKGFFDIVTSFEVIEHINNPNEEIHKFNQLVREDGIVYITTPNFNSISRTILKGKWSIIEYPEHLSYYTKATLSKLFAKHGFQTITTATTGISIDRIKQGLKKSTTTVNNSVRSDESIRAKAEGNGLFKLLVGVANFLLNITSKGDALKATYRKISSR